MEIHLVTPLTWSAALVPPLSRCQAELVVRESGDFPVMGESVVACVVHVESTNLVAVADWIEVNASSKRLRMNGLGVGPLVVVVGTDGLRYQWKLRELGVTEVVSHVWEAPRVAAIIRRHLGRLPQSDDRWPSWVHARLANAKSTKNKK